MSSALIKNQKDQVRELIDASESIGVIVSENQDIDTVAAATSLYLILREQGKNVQIVSKKIPEVSVSNLVGVDKIAKNFSGTTKTLTISVPYREGEIEKVSYNIEDTRLNVNLFAEASGIRFDENDIQYIRKGSQPQTLIIIGVSSEAELAGLVDLKSVKTINIDRNPLNSLSGDITIVDPTFTSLSEIVAHLIMELNLGYDLDAFQNLLDGIISATRNFSAPNTSPYSFEAAGFLLQNGAKRKEISQPQSRRDNRFPREEHFLKQRTSQNRPQNNPRLSRPPMNNSASINSNAPHANIQDSFQEPAPIEGIEGVESTGVGEVPEDWFLPKVFKGAHKGS